jgi:hypothetical protein
VTLADEGWYTCVAKNAFGMTFASAYLHVVDSKLQYARVGFEVLKAMVMKSTIFWDVTLCSLLKVN